MPQSHHTSVMIIVNIGLGDGLMASGNIVSFPCARQHIYSNFLSWETQSPSWIPPLCGPVTDDLINNSLWLLIGSGQIQTPGMFHYSSDKLAETNDKIGQ